MAKRQIRCGSNRPLKPSPKRELRYKPMKRPYPNIFRPCALILATWLAPLGLHAAQLAYEGFDYTVGDPVNTPNLGGMNGGSGWNGAWQTINGSGGGVLAGSLSAGANSPSGYDLLSTGNKCGLQNGRRCGRHLNTSSNGPFGLFGYRDGNGRIGADGTTLYLSFMQQPNGTTPYYEFEFHNSDLGDGGRRGGIGNDVTGNNVYLRTKDGANNNVQTLIGAGNTNVNFYVVRIDFGSPNDSVYVYQNPTSATDPGIGPGGPTMSKTDIPDMSFSGISLGAFANDRTVMHDEIRFGTSWADVAAPVLAQPVFAKQPKTSTTVYTGGSVTLTAAAHGYPVPTYQWYHGVDPVPGQTSTTLTLTNVQPSDAGAYHLVATNSQGATSSADGSLVVQATPAGLLVYEGFDYDAGTLNMDGKGGGLGWAAPWVAVDNNGGTVESGSLAAGTNAPNGYDNQSLGSKSLIPNGRRDGRFLDTSASGRLFAEGYVDNDGNVGADNKVLYMSFLQQPNGTTKFYEFELHKDNLGDGNGQFGRRAGIGNDTDNAVVNLRTPNNSPTLIGPGSTGVNFYVVRIDFKPGNADEIRVYQNPVSATEPGVATVTKTNGGDLSFDGISFGAFLNGRTVKHDEIRIGKAWSDVVFGTSRRNLTWVGNGTTNNWDFVSNNWNDGVGATAFADGDPVTFNDNGSDAPAVNVATNVATASLIATNSTKNYTLGGTGTITSSGGLTKSGSGSFTLTAPASFGSSVVLNGGNLALNGTSTAAGNLVLGASAGTMTLEGNNTFNGSLLDSGTGNRVFSGTNVFTGFSSSNGVLAFSGTTTFPGFSSSTGDLTFTGTTNFVGGAGAKVWFGNLTGTTDVTIEPGAAINITGNYDDSLVFGRDGGSSTVVQNGGTLTFNAANRGEAFIGASGAATGTSSTYEMKGGVLDLTGKRLGIALGGSGAGVTGVFTQTGGSVLVRQLDLVANFAFGNATYSLTGGSITIGAGGITTQSETTELYAINLGGGTVGASANWNTPLEMTLTGTNGNTTINTDINTVRLSGAIDGSGGLVKSGAGTLILTGPNTYSGLTQVNAGTIGGQGTSSNSALALGAAATLAPGEEFTELFESPSAVLASGSTFHVKIDNGNDLSDQLRTDGTANIAGANLTFSEFGAGTVVAGTELIIVDAIGGLTGTFAGLAEGATVDTGVNTFTIHYSTNQVILTSTTVANPYITWTGDNGLAGDEAAFDADPDGDGVVNGLEWVLGGDPNALDGSSLIDVTGNGTSGLTLTFSREEDSIGIATVVVEWSNSLGGNWVAVPITQSGGSYANSVVVTVDEDATPDDVEVVIPASNAPNGRLFARLRVTMPE